MKRHLPTRLLVCAAMVGTASLTAVAGFGSTAGAGTPLTLTCTTTTGNSTAQNVSGCSGTAAIAADAGPAPTTGHSVVEGAVPKSSGSVYSYDTFKSNKTALARIKETLNTKPTTAECAATHAGPGAQKIFGYVTYTGSVLKSATINKKAYTTTATGMVGGAAKGADCIYKSGSGSTRALCMCTTRERPLSERTHVHRLIVESPPGNPGGLSMFGPPNLSLSWRRATARLSSSPRRWALLCLWVQPHRGAWTVPKKGGS